MMIRATARVGLAFVVLWASAPAVPAQELPHRPGEPSADLSPGEVVRLFDAYAVVQAQDLLRLTEAQYGQFVTRLKLLQETRRRYQRERNQIMQELARVSQQEPPPEEGAVRDKLKALQQLEDRALVDIRKAYDAVDQVLDVRQQGRFRLFEQQMERRKLELLARARAANRPAARRPRL